MKVKGIDIYLRILNYARPYKWRIVISMAAAVGMAASDAILARLVQPFIDQLIIAGDKGLARWVPVMIIGLAVLKGGSMYIQKYSIQTAGQLALMDMRNDLYGHLVTLPMRFYAKTSVGVLMSRILNDVNVMQSAVSDVLVSSMRDTVTLIALTGVAFYTDWKMAAIALLVLPATGVPVVLIGRRIKSYSRRGQQAMGSLTSVLEQTFSGIKVIKSFGNEVGEHSNFVQQNRSYYNFLRKVFKYDSGSSPIMEILSSFGVAAVLWYGLSRAISGEMTQGELFSVLTAIMLMYAPLKRLTRVNNLVQQALASAERVFEVLDEPNEIMDTSAPVQLERARGEISFEHVSFSYGTEPVLSDFTLKVEPGEIIALVGPSGAGKSTLVGLLSRFYDPVSGVIRIDGHDIRDLSMASLKSNIALVDQETFLFNDSIRNNIRYGRFDATEAEVAEAANKAYAADFIAALDAGYDTETGTRGLNVSGGQRQRLCIARAILKDAPILLLDEATSALDTESEVKVQQALVNLMKGRTTLVIAHRLSTIMHADKIVVIDQGRICQVGKHQELLKQEGLYQKLYNMQFQDEE
ncbi:MAG: lipid A export permease/ATP-binding protein MsbA [Desulfuromonadales bacterium]